MHIAVDAREAFSKNATGKGIWARNVILELERRGIRVTRMAAEDCTNHILWHIKAAYRLRNVKPDLYLSPTSFISPKLIQGKIPCAIVVHDLIAFEKGIHDKKAKLLERCFLPATIKNTKNIFTVSDTTRNALLKRFPHTSPERVTTIYAGPSIQRDFIANTGRVETVSGECSNTAGKYVISIGTLCPRKNQFGLINAWNALPDGIRKANKLLLVGGRGWNCDATIKLAMESENVEWLNYRSDCESRALLQNAAVLAYPSLMEGFGMPVLDAMSIGIPVLTSDKSSMKEVANGAALLVNPENIDDIAKNLELLLTDNNLRLELATKGKKRAAEFSWRRTVDLMLQAL